MIYVISKATFGSYNVRDIQCNANWCSCPYSDYALIPDSMVEGILATQGYCDIVLTEDGSEVAAFTAREIPSVPEECWGERTATEAYVDARTMIATDPNNDGNIVLKYGGNVVPGGGGSGGSGGSGIHIGAEPPTDENVEVWIDTDEEVPESGGGSQADWNANEGEPGHVLNRTHYENGTEHKTLFEKDVTTTSNQFAEAGVIGFVVGETYTVWWDGVEYNCTAIGPLQYSASVTAIGIGNMAIMGGDNTGEPFIIVDMSNGFRAIATAVDGTYSVKITKGVKAYKKLDDCYLPYSARSYIIKLTTEDTQNVYGKITITRISYDEFADILWGGGSVLLDLSAIYSNSINFMCRPVMWAYANGEVSLNFITSLAPYGDNYDPCSVSSLALTFTSGTWTPPTE
jgi:hypothetical protein